MDLITVALGFALAFAIGLSGVGGGALVAPALFVILDLPYAEAVGTSLVYSLITKVLSGAQHIRQGTVRWRVALLFGLWGIPGAVAGSYLLYGVGKSSRAFPLLMGVLLLVVAGLLAIEAAGLMRSWGARALNPEKISTLASVGIGVYSLAVGVLMGVTSVGSGSLIILLMMCLLTLPAREVVGTNIVIALMMVLPAGATHFGLGGVSLRVLAVLVIGSIAGAPLGARATLWISDPKLRYGIALFVLISAIATLAKGW